MSEMEKKLADSLAKAAAALPENKREFLLGYAEGVAAMTEAKAPAAPAVEDKPEEVKKNGRKCKRTARKTDDYAFRAVKECEKCCGFVSIDTRDG